MTQKKATPKVTVRLRRRAVEELVSGPRRSFRKYAIKSLLIELSNFSDINLDEPGIAGTFYIMAVSRLKGSQDKAAQRCLRHLDILLNNPNRRTMKAIMEYWDNDGRVSPVDPFPADDDRPSNSPKDDTETGDGWGGGPESDPELENMRQRLMRLERLPENEAIALQLESEIYKLERQNANTDEWPDVIGGLQ